VLVDINVFGDSLGRTFQDNTADMRRAEYALESAESLVVSYANRDEDWVTAAALPRVAQTVIYEVAARKFNNPKGLLSRNVGPLAESMSPAAAVGLALSDEEKASLSPYRKAGRGGLQSVPIVRPDMIGADTLYFSDNYPGSVMRIPFVDAEEAELWPG
jgi:hypothetical protein